MTAITGLQEALIFTFQYGSIKIKEVLPEITKEKNFTFQYGSIKICIFYMTEDCRCMTLHSNMVQLKSKGGLSNDIIN